VQKQPCNRKKNRRFPQIEKPFTFNFRSKTRTVLLTHRGRGQNMEMKGVRCRVYFFFVSHSRSPEPYCGWQTRVRNALKCTHLPFKWWCMLFFYFFSDNGGLSWSIYALSAGRREGASRLVAIFGLIQNSAAESRVLMLCFPVSNKCLEACTAISKDLNQRSWRHDKWIRSSLLSTLHLRALSRALSTSQIPPISSS